MEEGVFHGIESGGEDPDLARRRYLLNLVLLGLAVPGLLFGIVMAVMWAMGRVPVIGMLAGFGVQPPYLLAYWLGRRGRVRLAAYVPVVVVFLVMVGTSYWIGIGHVVFIGYAMATLTAGILIGTGAALALSLLSMAAHLVVGMVQAAGGLPGAVAPEATVIPDGIGMAFGLAVLVVFDRLSNREVNRALRRERELTAQLQEHRSELEQRVSERTVDLTAADERLRSEISERARAEQALRFTQFAVDHAADAVFWMGPDARLLYVNKGACDSLGYSREELLSMTVQDIDPDFPREVWSDHWQELKQRGSMTLQSRHRTKDGRAYAVEISANHQEFEGQEYNCAFVRDITERVRADQDLKRRARQQEQLLGAARQLTASLDTNTVLRQIGAGAKEILDAYGCAIYLLEPDGQVLTPVVAIEPPYEELILSTPLDVEISFTGQAVKARRSLIFNDPGGGDVPGQQILGTPVEEDERILVSPFIVGDQVLGAMCLNRIGTLFTDEDLALAETFASYAETALKNAQTHRELQREVEERVRAEAERERLLAQVREQAQQMQHIMDTVPEGVFLLDAQLRILLVNPAARRHLLTLTEARRGDILTDLGDRPLAEFLTSPPNGLWHEVTAGDQSFEVISRPVEAGPTTGGWALVIRDVTQEREIQERVQQQERLAAVGQLAAGIAHDFNNILAVIVLYAQMLLRTPELPPRGHERLGTIVEQAKRATHLIQQIVDFSRRAMLKQQPLDLAPFLREQVELLDRTLPENIRIDLTSQPDEPAVVNADPTRIQQVIMNLALNARDAMPGGGELCIDLEQVRVRPGEPPPLPEMKVGTWLRIQVSDSGTGIPPEVLPHLFEPFFTTRAPLGSGLGLAQVYGIVKQHEGHIDVATEVGEGTTFSLYLPALTVSRPDLSAAKPEATVAGQGQTVLVVEDDPAVRKALVGSLEVLNYRALEAANGREALSVFGQRGDEIALVLSDLVMPEMGGKALAHALRELDPTVRVVVLSGHSLGGQAESLRSAGVVAWLRKPPTLQQLAQVLGRVLKGE